MLRFDQNEQHRIMEYYQQLQDMMTGQVHSTGNVALALLALIPNADYNQLMQDCLKLESGISRFQEIYGDPESGEPVDTDQLLDKLTAGMDEQQRKGFYLDIYESLRESDCGILREARAAQSAGELIHSVDEEKLRALVAEQVTLDSQELTGGIVEEDADMIAVQPSDPMLYAASIYAASLDGSISSGYAASAEMTGVCAAAATTLVSQIHANPQKTKDKYWVAKVIAGICAAALLVALTIYAAPVVIASVKTMIAQFSWTNAATVMRVHLRPVLKTAKYCLPAMLVGLKDELTDMAQSARDRLIDYYLRISSKSDIAKEADLPQIKVEKSAQCCEEIEDFQVAQHS